MEYYSAGQRLIDVSLRVSVRGRPHVADQNQPPGFVAIMISPIVFEESSGRFIKVHGSGHVRVNAKVWACVRYGAEVAASATLEPLAVHLKTGVTETRTVFFVCAVIE